MKNRNRQNTRQTFGRSIFCTALAMAVLGMTGCEDPQLLDTNEYYCAKEIVLPDGDNYDVDIAMITPLSGRLNPIGNSINFYIKAPNTVQTEPDDKQDIYFNFKKELDEDSSAPIYTYDTLTLNNEILRSTFHISDENDMYIDISHLYPESTAEESINHRIPCKFAEETDTDDGLKDYKIDGSPLKKIVCKYEYGGIPALQNTWNLLGRDNVKQIRVSSGDSFGVSADISARFDDIPTPLMLNAIGLHTDTFGNHSFDKNLNYLKDVISWADFHFLASNLTNISKNLPTVSPRVLIDIPSKDTNNSNMRLAIVSALDMQANEFVFPGRFGTLDIGNYCTLIQSIEDAYNDGARAFFIIGHMLMQNDSLKSFLNSIFYFADHRYHFFDKDCISYDPNKPTDDPTNIIDESKAKYCSGIEKPLSARTKLECSSVLEISSERLIKGLTDYYQKHQKVIKQHVAKDQPDFGEADFVVSKISEINFAEASNVKIKYTENGEIVDYDNNTLIPEDNNKKRYTLNHFRADAYKNIIEEIHKEIYQGIIGVLGEGSDNPMVTLLHPSPNPNDISKCTPHSSVDETQALSYPYPNKGCETTTYNLDSDNTQKINYSLYSHMMNMNLLPFYHNERDHKPDEALSLSSNNVTFSVSHTSKASSCYPNESANLLFTSAGLNCYELNFEEFISLDDHPIAFIQFPSYGENTLQLNVSIDKKGESYISNLKSIRYVPIVDLLEETNYDNPEIPKGETIKDYLASTLENIWAPKSLITCEKKEDTLGDIVSSDAYTEQCSQYLDHDSETHEAIYNCVCDADDMKAECPNVCSSNCQSNENNPCLMYFNSQIKTPQIVTSIVKLNSKKQEYLNLCFDYLRKYILSNQNSNSDRNLREMTNQEATKLLTAINTLHTVTSKQGCHDKDSNTPDGTIDKFEEPLLFSFKNSLWEIVAPEISDNKKYIRSRSTFETNLAVDSILYYMNQYHKTKGETNNNIYDFAMINAGGIRDKVKDIGYIKYSTVTELTPYDNQVIPVTITATQFVHLVEAALINYDKSDYSSGGYPVFAGIQIATKFNTTNNKVEVVAAWLVDQNGQNPKAIYARCDLINDADNNITFTHSDTVNDNILDICKDRKSPYPDVGANEKTYKMLTLNYLTSGGDNYNFEGITINLKPLEYQTKDYIYAYLNSNEEENDKQEIQSCLDVSNTPLSNKSYDGRNPNELLCALLKNRHFNLDDESLQKEYIIGIDDTQCD